MTLILYMRNGYQMFLFSIPYHLMIFLMYQHLLTAWLKYHLVLVSYFFSYSLSLTAFLSKIKYFHIFIFFYFILHGQMHVISVTWESPSDWPSGSRSLSGASHVPISIFFSVSANRKPINLPTRYWSNQNYDWDTHHPLYLGKNDKYSSYTRDIRENERKLTNHTEKGTERVQCHSDQTVHFS